MAEKRICPRAKSDMTPCIATDGDVAFADDGVCVGCGWKPASMAELRRLRSQLSVRASSEAKE